MLLFFLKLLNLIEVLQPDAILGDFSINLFANPPVLHYIKKLHYEPLVLEEV